MTPDLPGLRWRKSSYSGPEGDNCVEVASNGPGVVAVRDSKNPAGRALVFAAGEWSTFVSSIKSDALGV
jgi:hypothetical protein